MLRELSSKQTLVAGETGGMSDLFSHVFSRPLAARFISADWWQSLANTGSSGRDLVARWRVLA